jgi:predicted DCC family thiol-disulfide oxidoreductase YuxK
MKLVTNNCAKPILLYDGYCNLCSWLVRVVHRFDRKHKIMQLALKDLDSSPCIVRLDSEFSFPDSIAYISQTGHIYFRSDAILMTLKTIGGYWLILWWLIVIFPRGIRDYLYRVIAKNRYEWFGRNDTCFYPPKH